MRVLLAPMEGVVDHLMRDMLTRVGGFDLCVTEFVRIVDQKLPQKTFYRLCPELHEGGKTPSGVPVRVQLLGQHPQWLAENALTAVELGSPGVDLNFGCPAKTVNKSKGGAVLLQYTELLHDIVKAVREAVPAHLPVTAKIRLGFEDKSLAIDNAVAIDEAGASELVVHARTKTEGYRPPAYWDWIKKIRANTRLPVIANGEIECGPNAVFTFKREGYRRTDFSIKDTLDALTFPGTHKLFINHWKFGLNEYKRAFSKSLFLKELQKMIPSLKMGDIVRGRSGVRAMALKNNGEMLDDFLIMKNKSNIHVINAPSPAATACLAIAEEIMKVSKEHFKL